MEGEVGGNYVILDLLPAVGMTAALDIFNEWQKSTLISMVNLQFISVVGVVINFNILLGDVHRFE